MDNSRVTYLIVAGHTLVIYLFLVLGLRRIGRRAMGQLTIIEYLIIALLGSSVETGLYAGSNSLGAGLVSAMTLLLADWALSTACRMPAVRRFLVSEPVLLVHDGQVLAEHLRQNYMTRADLMAAIRRRGYASLDDVRFAVLEIDGSVGVVPRIREP